MKRIFIVCLCLSFLSLLIIPSFAEERVVPVSDLRIAPSDPLPYQFYFVSSYPSVGSVSYSTTLVGSFSFLGSDYTYLFLRSDGTYPVSVSLGNAFSGADSVPIFSSSVLGQSFVINSMSTSDFTLAYSILSTVETFPTPLDNLDVSSGVSSFISWTGSVLSNLIASPYVLPLVGLSVALCLIIPFGISKIKELIKGY